MTDETRITTRFEDGVPVVDIDGELDHQAIPVFREQVLQLVDRRYASGVVDMSDVTFMDSGGMSGIIFAIKHFSAAGGRLALAACSERINRKLTIGGLVKLADKLVLTASVQEAVELLKHS